MHYKERNVMRLVKYLLAATCAVAVAAPAAAQTNGTNGATTPDPAAAAAAAAAVATPQAVNIGEIRHHWTAAGFAGTNFSAVGDDVRVADHTSVHFGGQVGYLWNGIVGAEFVSDLSPKFEVAPNTFADNPQVYTYMTNAIAAIPLGDKGQIQPYGSGGIGAVQMVSDVFNVGHDIAKGTTSANEFRLGTNVGGGLMAFVGNLGFRADVRYYHTTTDNNPNTTAPAADQQTHQLLSGLAFWRTNVGVAFRW